MGRPARRQQVSPPPPLRSSWHHNCWHDSVTMLLCVVTQSVLVAKAWLDIQPRLEAWLDINTHRIRTFMLHSDWATDPTPCVQVAAGRDQGYQPIVTAICAPVAQWSRPRQILSILHLCVSIQHLAASGRPRSSDGTGGSAHSLPGVPVCRPGNLVGRLR